MSKIYIKKITDINPSFGGDGRGFGMTIAPIALLPTTLGATQSDVEGGLETGTYYYVVTSLGINGESKATDELEVVVDSSLSDKRINLTWDSQDDVTYRLYRYEKDGAEKINEVYRNVSTNSFQDLNAGWLLGYVVPDGEPKIDRYNYSYIMGIQGVDPIFIEGDGADVKRRCAIRVNTESLSIDIDLEKVLNQPSWSDGTYEGVLKAVEDIMSW